MIEWANGWWRCWVAWGFSIKAPLILSWISSWRLGETRCSPDGMEIEACVHFSLVYKVLLFLLLFGYLCSCWLDSLDRTVGLYLTLSFGVLDYWCWSCCRKQSYCWCYMSSSTPLFLDLEIGGMSRARCGLTIAKPCGHNYSWYVEK